MADDGQLGRVEERVEQLVKRFDRYELMVERQLESLEKGLQGALTGRMELLEARYSVVRLIVFALAGGILVAFLNFLVGGWLGVHPSKIPPQMAPYHSSEELRERIVPR